MVVHFSRRLKIYIAAWTALILIFILLLYLAASGSAIYIRTSSKAAASQKTVIVDAGHGGIDGGASAADGTVEKDINLAIAIRLRDMLRACGYNVITTRDTDAAICSEDAKTIRQQKVSDIRNRMKIIEETENSIFISVHQNHFESAKYSGTQTFYSKNNPESKVLAQSIQNSVVKQLQPDNNRAVKKTGTEIYLLYHAQSPAIMVECGFLSNADDTQKLKSEEYQSQMAFSIMDGIITYLTAGESGGATEEK